MLVASRRPFFRALGQPSRVLRTAGDLIVNAAGSPPFHYHGLSPGLVVGT